jgi:rhamnosyltransferase
LDVSIVIRAKNEAREIGDTLTTVFSQIEAPQFEVIVVDSGSSDRTVQIVQQFPAQLIEIPAETFTYGRSLNIGVRAGSGDLVVSLSAHAHPTSERWLANLVSPFHDPTIAAVYGRHVPRENATRLELFGMWLSGVTSDRPRRQVRDMMFSNANGAFRRWLALEHPFDERIPGAEDLAWADWIQRQGWAVWYEPTAAVFHSHGESLARLIRRLIKDQPTIWGLKLGMFAPRQPAAHPEQTRTTPDPRRSF